MKIKFLLTIFSVVCLSAHSQPYYYPGTPFIQSIGGGTSSSGGGGITNLPANALGGLWNDGVGGLSWLTAPAISLANVSSGTLPPSAASTSWPPVTNAIMSTNLSGSTIPGMVPVSLGNTNGYGAQATQFRQLEFTNVAFIVYTNAFTNTINGFLVFTNGGIKYTIPVGTNAVTP